MSRHRVTIMGLGATVCGAGTASLCDRATFTSALAQADKLFDSNDYGAVADVLRGALTKQPNDVECLWRLGRAFKKLADAEMPKSAAKKALVMKGFECTDRALALSAECGPAHKWHAILLSESGAFEGTSATIKNSFNVRHHFERAVELSPDDATARHLLGLWCYEVAKLSWFEQKAAAAFFATPPTATFSEAVEHFEAAERMDPGFYPKNLLMLAQAYAKMGKVEVAKEWLSRCLAAKPGTPEDEQTIAEAQKLKI